MLERLSIAVFLGLLVAVFVLYLIFRKYRWGFATRLYLMAVVITTFVTITVSILNHANNTAAADGLIVNRIIGVAVVGTSIVIISYTFYRIMIRQLQDHVSMLVSSINNISSTAQQAATTASEQAAVAAQVSSTLAALQQTGDAMTQSAKNVLSAALVAVEKGESGQKAMDSFARSIGRIAEIVNVVNSVGALADQSNLLAVNAGIEAAKAGEHGRGFSVVAAEVRNLATQSKSATNQIRTTIERVEEGKRSLETTRSVIHELSTVLKTSSDAARRISGATMQQSAGLKEINASMLAVAAGGKDTAAGADALRSEIRRLDAVATSLHAYVNGRSHGGASQ